MTIVKAIKSFAYPGDPKVRDKIRKFHSTTLNVGIAWDGDRGKAVEVSAGEVIEAPADLLDSWLAAELVVVPIAVSGDPEEGGSNG